MKREKTNRRRKLYEVITDFAEIPADTVTSVPTLIVRGEHEVEADGVGGILEYGERQVMLAVGKRRVLITGEMLTLSNFTDDSLLVRGNIAAVHLSEDGNAQGTA